MPVIDGFGDEVVTFLIFAFILLVLVLGWTSTFVREVPYRHTVIIGSGGRHQNLITVPATAAIQADGGRTILDRLVDQITSGSGHSANRHQAQSNTASGSSNPTNNNNTNNNNISGSGDGELYVNYPYWDELRRRQAEYLIDHLENGGPEAIIREMDRDLEDINTSSENSPERENSEQSELENCANENSENDHRMGQGSEDVARPIVQIPEENAMKIKLKYLNDDLKVVEGKPSQTIGDFKQKNFTVELEADKLVRLVFNGHVLQPDSKTLKKCGLFDNCVVHCLIHVKERIEGSPSRSNSRNRSGGLLATATSAALGIPGPDQANSNSEPTANAAQNTERTVFSYFVDFYHRSPFIKHLLMLLFSVFVIYIRTQFAHLFTLTSTVGFLISSLMTFAIGYTLLLM